MVEQVTIADTAIWFKHVENPALRNRLMELHDEESIQLEADGIVGRWVRMKTGSDGRPTQAIRPDGRMKAVWSAWYKTRRGQAIQLREVVTADSYLKGIASQFPEWESAQDEEAFRDL